jgi:hypothetical protein
MMAGLGRWGGSVGHGGRIGSTHWLTRLISVILVVVSKEGQAEGQAERYQTKALPKRQQFQLSGVRFNKPVDPSERQGGVNDINDEATENPGLERGR